MAYRRNDRLTVSADISTTDWSDFTIQDGTGTKTSLVDGSSGDTLSDFDRVWTLRLGAEYVFLPKQPSETLTQLWTLRGGLLFDQEPASGRSTFDSADPGDGDPDQFYGASVGVGLQLFNRVNIDAAYQLRYGNNVNSDLIRGLPGFEDDVLQHRFLLSAVLYF